MTLPSTGSRLLLCALLAAALLPACQNRRKSDNGASPATLSAGGAGATPGPTLGFYICAQLDEVANINQLRQQLALQGAGPVDGERYRWLPIAHVEQWLVDADEARRFRENPFAYFNTRKLVAGKHADAFYLLVWNTSSKRLDHQTPGWRVTSASIAKDELGQRAIAFELDKTGGGRMRLLTSSNKGKPMALVIDGRVYSAPVIMSEVTSQGLITGGPDGFSKEEAQRLIGRLTQ